MSAPRSLHSPADLSPGDHVAWAMDGSTPTATVVGRFLHEGVERGERIYLVREGSTAPETPPALLPDLPDTDRLLDTDQLRLRSTDETYELVVSGDVWGQADRLRAEADRALADGYTGIRVWADVTPLARDEATLRNLLDYELAIERTFRAVPATGMCALDVREAGAPWCLFASRHRVRRGPDEFPLLAVDLHDNVLHVVGDLDVSGREALQDTLASARRTTAGTLVVDLSDLDFLDVAGARTFARFVADLDRSHRKVRVVGARGLHRRVLEMFPLPGGVVT